MDITPAHDKYKETKRIIRNAKLHKKLVLFVGSGVSINSGMPTWFQAISEIADKLYLEKKEDILDNLRIPQYYYNARGKKEYTELMRSIFRYGENLEPNEIDRRIIDFDTPVIITTNYDNLIEKAAEEKNIQMQVVSKDVDIPYCSDERIIIKMHGDFENNNFVLKEDDYLNYSKNFRLIETYIKSLLASRVILFLGYSFNDPDIKHIFTWVKDILGGDFQRAYIIITGKDPDENERQYFLNIGINIIYGTEFDKKEENSAHDVQLLRVMDYILIPDEKSDLEKAYDYIKPMSILSYIHSKYINEALNLLAPNITFDCEYIKISRCKNIKDLTDVHKVLNYIFKGKASSVMHDTFLDVISKSIYKYFLISNKNKISIKSEGEKKEALPIDIYKFKYGNISTLLRKNVSTLHDNNPMGYLKHAYMLYVLKDYVAAYNYMRIASKVLCKKNMYWWYFISLYNQKALGTILLDNVYLFDIDFEEKKNISREINSIDLDNILRKIPDLGNNQNQILMELSKNKLHNYVFGKIFENSRKVLKEANDNYIIFAKRPEYEYLRFNFVDYINFVIGNYLVVDTEPIYRNIVVQYIQSVFYSASKKEITQDNRIVPNFLSGNIKIKKFEPIDIYVLLNYFTSSEIISNFNLYFIENISLSEDAEKYIYDISNDILSADKFIRKDIAIKLFWKYVILITYTNLTIEKARMILSKIADLFNPCHATVHRAEISIFFNRLNLLSKSDILECLSEINLLLNKAIENIRDKNSFTEIQFTMKNLLSILQKSGNVYDDISLIGKVEKFIDLDDLIAISSLLGENSKKVISEKILNWNPDNTSNDYHVYCMAVECNLIIPNESIEENMISWCRDVITNHKEGDIEIDSDGVPTNVSFSQLCCDFVNLFLNDKIKRKKDLQDLMTLYDNKQFIWVTDMEHFNYDDFELEWLNSCSNSVLEKISTIETAKNKIIDLMKADIEYKKENSKLVNRIIQYVI